MQNTPNPTQQNKLNSENSSQCHRCIYLIYTSTYLKEIKCHKPNHKHIKYKGKKK